MKRTIITITAVSLMALTIPASAAHHEKHGKGAVDVAATQNALTTSETRPAEDKERDVGRKPAEVLSFLGLKQGDTVYDVLASGGWYTEALSVAVGPKGKVYAHNTPLLLTFRDGFYDKAITKRLEGGRLANVVRLDEDMEKLSIPADSVDFAITALNFHDVYNRFGEEQAISFLTAVKSRLKPGGVFGLIDHVGNPDGDNQKLHRIDPALAVKSAEAAGFIVKSQGQMLANPADDHTVMVFDPAIRGKTDRFVLKLVKPKP